MPVTFSDNFATAQTPLRELLPFIQNLLPQMVPERSDDYDRLAQELAWHLQLDETSGEFRFNANTTGDPPQNVITVSLAALERTWAFVYSFLFLFDESNANLGVEITPAHSPQTQDAFILLDWAMYGLTKRKRLPWDQDLPRPDDSALDRERLEKTNYLFFGTLAFIMLHEIAHLKKGHSKEKYPVPRDEREDELTADRYAADWLLHSLPAGRQRIDRCNWIALALCVINLIEFTKRRGPAETHPATVERLITLAKDFNSESINAGVSDSDFSLFLANRIIGFQNENLITGCPLGPMDTLQDRLFDLFKDFETAYHSNTNLNVHEKTRAHDFRRTQGSGPAIPGESR